MVISQDILRKELVATLNLIELQIKEVRTEANRMNLDPEKLRDHNGNWVMIPLLLGKIQALQALTQLQYPGKR